MVARLQRYATDIGTKVSVAVGVIVLGVRVSVALGVSVSEIHTVVMGANISVAVGVMVSLAFRSCTP